IQRNLQVRIEEQGKQLKKMFDLQQKTSNDLFKTQNLDITCHEDAPSDSLNAIQIQRNSQLRIEEQGKQLKKMFDLQQKISNDLFKTQNLDITCHEDAPSDSLNAIQVLSPEDSGNSNFPSKIS
ncbi:Hypothetical predicted protein, partial [Prunus dulcis]